MRRLIFFFVHSTVVCVCLLNTTHTHTDTDTFNGYWVGGGGIVFNVFYTGNGSTIEIRKINDDNQQR